MNQEDIINTIKYLLVVLGSLYGIFYGYKVFKKWRQKRKLLNEMEEKFENIKN